MSLSKFRPAVLRTGAIERRRKLTDCQSQDRRLVRRYALNVRVDFELEGNSGDIGYGVLVNISSTGILIDAERRVPVGVKTIVNVPWPARLNGAIAVTLRITGETIRADGGRVAIRISHSEFCIPSKTRALASTDGMRG
jgi:hypothetical protein